MARYIIRNGGFDIKSAKASKPVCVEGRGVMLEHVSPFSKNTVTPGRRYIVRSHFCYWNTYGPKGLRFAMWDQFVTIKNDNGFTIKMNLNNFYLVPDDIMEVLRQAQ